MSSIDIHTNKNEIKKCDLQIQSLGYQLRVVQQERQIWETRLALVMTEGLDHVNKCPPEILTEIFRLYLDPRHRHVRTLLLVCKKWNKLVMNTPSLWNRIDLYFDSRLSTDGSVSLTPYVQACKQRSQNLSLDVHLNLKNIGNAFEYHISIVRDSQCRNCLHAACATSPAYDDDDGEYWNCPRFKKRMEELMDTARVLVGNNSNDMGRWSSFHLTLPGRDILSSVSLCHLFDGPTDSLLSFSIEGLEGWTDIAIFGDEFDLFPVTGDLSRIERLTLSHDSDIDAIPFQWPSIKHLDIVIRNEQNLVAISTLRSLETLAITMKNFNMADLGQTIVRYYLPHLRSMDIKGPLINIWFDIIDLEAPSLQRFSLGFLKSGDSYSPFKMSFPKISPRTLSFNILTTLQFGHSYLTSSPWIESNLRMAANQVLHHFSSAKEIIFGGFRDETILAVLTDRVQSGQKSPNSVYSERGGDFYRLYHAPVVAESS